MGVPLANDSLYAVLGLRRDADSEVVIAAFRALAKKYHPDVAAGDKQIAAENFNAIHTAFEVLGDPEKRRHYDASLVKSHRPRVISKRFRQPAEPKRGIWKIRMALLCFTVIALLKLYMDWPHGARDQAYGSVINSPLADNPKHIQDSLPITVPASLP